MHELLYAKKPNVFELMPEDFAALNPPNHPDVLFARVQRIGTWTTVKNEFSPNLGKQGLTFLRRHACFDLPQVVDSLVSSDGSTKCSLKLKDGAQIEVVHIPRNVKAPRVTLCLSSQVGCAMKCRFCATAKMGLIRNLTPSEIIGQVMCIMHYLGPKDPRKINLVFMGMGEPLHNLDAVLRAIQIMADERGLGIPPSRMTISTSGLILAIEKLGRAKVRPCLALSLNASNGETRRSLMPITREHSVMDLRRALLDFPRRPHEKLTIEYVVIRGINDSKADALDVVEFTRGMKCNINVIPYNPFLGSCYETPDTEVIQQFVKTMQDAGCLVTVRRSRGADISGACGQLIHERLSG